MRGWYVLPVKMKGSDACFVMSSGLVGFIQVIQVVGLERLVHPSYKNDGKRLKPETNDDSCKQEGLRHRIRKRRHGYFPVFLDNGDSSAGYSAYYKQKQVRCQAEKNQAEYQFEQVAV